MHLARGFRMEDCCSEFLGAAKNPGSRSGSVIRGELR